MNSKSRGETLGLPGVIKITFSTNLIIKFIAFIGGILLLLRLSDALLTIFIAFIIMAAIKPAATYINIRFRLSEGASISLVFVLILTIFSLTLYTVGSPLSTEISRFADNIPEFSRSTVQWISDIPIIHNNLNQEQLRSFFDNLYSGLAEQFNLVANTIGNALIGAFQGIFQTLFILIFAIYLYLERESIKSFIVRLFKLKRNKFNLVYDRIESQLGAWVRGQLFLGLSVGILTYIGLLVLDIKYALPLAILAGVLEIIPVIGPVVTGIILTLVGVSIDPIKGLLAMLLSFFIQQVENNLLVPWIMQRAVGLSPVLTIISILVGQSLFGIIGAIIAVPSAAMLTVIINTFLDDRDNKLISARNPDIKEPLSINKKL